MIHTSISLSNKGLFIKYLSPQSKKTAKKSIFRARLEIFPVFICRDVLMNKPLAASEKFAIGDY